VLLVPYVLLTLNGDRKRAAAGLDTTPPILIGLQMAVVIAGVIVGVSILNADRGVPLATLIFVGIVILVDFVLRHTAFGRHVYAVGGNAEASRRAGISLSRIRLIVFASASTLAAVGGVMLASRLFAVNQSAGGSDLLSTRSLPPLSAARASSGAEARRGRRCSGRWSSARSRTGWTRWPSTRT
jgi:D-xylose transport system permease protein